MDRKPRLRDALSTTDFVIGTGIALAMGASFSLLSSGLSLIVTFVPGVILAWLVYGWIYVKRMTLPSKRSAPPFESPAASLTSRPGCATMAA